MNSRSDISRPRRPFLNSWSVLPQPLRPLLCLPCHGPLLRRHVFLFRLLRHGSLLRLFCHGYMIQFLHCSMIQDHSICTDLALRPTPWSISFPRPSSSRQYQQYQQGSINNTLLIPWTVMEKLKQETTSARSHNMDAEELMGMFSALKKKAPNATICYLSCKR